MACTASPPTAGESGPLCSKSAPSLGSSRPEVRSRAAREPRRFIAYEGTLSASVNKDECGFPVWRNFPIDAKTSAVLRVFDNCGL